MSTVQNELRLRLASADPGRRVAVDEDARRRLWEQVIADVDPPARRRRRDRVRSWLRRRAVVVPVIAVIGGAAFGAQPAWCACNHDRHQPALSSPSFTVSAAPAFATADPAAPPGLGGQPQRATR